MALTDIARRHILTGLKHEAAAKEVSDAIDSSGSSASDIAAVTPLTDSTTGSAGATLAAGTGVYDLVFPVTLPVGGTSAGDLVTAFTPGHKGKILAVSYVEAVAATGTTSSRVYNVEVGSTDVTGGVVTVTTASAAVGRVVAGTSVTAANTFSASDNISIEVASGGTTHDAGSGAFHIRCQNMDTADAAASLAAKVAAIITAAA